MLTAAPSSVLLGIQRAKHSLRGELIHAFISHCPSTEGPAGNRVAELVAVRIREPSLDSSQNSNLQIPRHRRGIWLKGAKRQDPVRPDEAKVSPAGA